MKTKKKLTILATPVAAVGHVNGCSGPLRTLLKRGHRIVFLLETAFKGSQAAHGFEEIIYSYRSNSAQNGDQNGHKESKEKEELTAGEVMARTMEAGKILGDHSPEEKLQAMIATFQSAAYYEQIVDFNAAIKAAIESISPDLIYHDSGFLYPAIHYSGIPWIRNTSMQILMNVYHETEVPPAFSGFPSTGADPAAVRHFNSLRRQLFYSPRYNDLLESLGYERFPFDAICPESQALTVYACPNELNYEYVKQFCWFNLEVFSRPEVVADDASLESLGVPKAFLEDDLDGAFSGKILYLSLGTIGGADLGLMRRLISLLSTVNHKVIVSLGPRASELPNPLLRNLWGERYLPQTSLLPFVDLVLTHGGNNTFTEVFARGKPMVVLPIFADQLDNAQRLQETGYGRRLDAYRFKDEQLLGAIEELLADESLKKRLQAAASRIQNSRRHEQLAEKLEDMFAYNSQLQLTPPPESSSSTEEVRS